MRPAPPSELHIGALSPDTPRGGLRSLCSPAVLAGGLTELAWLGAHVLMYPLGTRTEALRLDPRIRPGAVSLGTRALFAADPLAARTPVLLVHGLIDNRSVFTVMQRNLRRRGFAQVCSWNYSPLSTDVGRAARDLGKHIEGICEQTGYDRIHVVGHSLGGLLARYHVQRQGGDRRVQTLVTLGTPHQGSRWAHVVPTPLIRQLRPGSGVFQELAEPAPGCRTRFLAFYSDLDHLVVPSRNGRIEHPDLTASNVAVRGVGHVSMPNNGSIAFAIAAALGGLDPQRSTPEPNPG
jgi:pimeloyl-ACP methyl ester carboxylesterase